MVTMRRDVALKAVKREAQDTASASSSTGDPADFECGLCAALGFPVPHRRFRTPEDRQKHIRAHSAAEQRPEGAAADASGAGGSKAGGHHPEAQALLTAFPGLGKRRSEVGGQTSKIQQEEEEPQAKRRCIDLSSSSSLVPAFLSSAKKDASEETRGKDAFKVPVGKPKKASSTKRSLVSSSAVSGKRIRTAGEAKPNEGGSSFRRVKNEASREESSAEKLDRKAASCKNETLKGSIEAAKAQEMVVSKPIMKSLAGENAQSLDCRAPVKEEASPPPTTVGTVEAKLREMKLAKEEASGAGDTKPRRAAPPTPAKPLAAGDPGLKPLQDSQSQATPTKAVSMNAGPPTPGSLGAAPTTPTKPRLAQPVTVGDQPSKSAGVGHAATVKTTAAGKTRGGAAPRKAKALGSMRPRRKPTVDGIRMQSVSKKPPTLKPLKDESGQVAKAMLDVSESKKAFPQTPLARAAQKIGQKQMLPKAEKAPEGSETAKPALGTADRERSRSEGSKGAAKSESRPTASTASSAKASNTPKAPAAIAEKGDAGSARKAAASGSAKVAPAKAKLAPQSVPALVKAENKKLQPPIKRSRSAMGKRPSKPDKASGRSEEKKQSGSKRASSLKPVKDEFTEAKAALKGSASKDVSAVNALAGEARKIGSFNRQKEAFPKREKAADGSQDATTLLKAADRGQSYRSKSAGKLEQKKRHFARPASIVPSCINPPKAAGVAQVCDAAALRNYAASGSTKVQPTRAKAAFVSARAAQKPVLEPPSTRSKSATWRRPCEASGLLKEKVATSDSAFATASKAAVPGKSGSGKRATSVSGSKRKSAVGRELAEVKSPGPRPKSAAGLPFIPQPKESKKPASKPVKAPKAAGKEEAQKYHLAKKHDGPQPKLKLKMAAKSTAGVFKAAADRGRSESPAEAESAAPSLKTPTGTPSAPQPKEAKKALIVGALKDPALPEAVAKGRFEAMKIPAAERDGRPQPKQRLKPAINSAASVSQIASDSKTSSQLPTSTRSASPKPAEVRQTSTEKARSSLPSSTEPFPAPPASETRKMEPQGKSTKEKPVIQPAERPQSRRSEEVVKPSEEGPPPACSAREARSGQSQSHSYVPVPAASRDKVVPASQLQPTSWSAKPKNSPPPTAVFCVPNASLVADYGSDAEGEAPTEPLTASLPPPAAPPSPSSSCLPAPPPSGTAPPTLLASETSGAGGSGSMEEPLPSASEKSEASAPKASEGPARSPESVLEKEVTEASHQSPSATEATDAAPGREGSGGAVVGEDQAVSGPEVGIQPIQAVASIVEGAVGPSLLDEHDTNEQLLKSQEQVVSLQPSAVTSSSHKAEAKLLGTAEASSSVPVPDVETVTSAVPVAQASIAAASCADLGVEPAQSAAADLGAELVNRAEDADGRLDASPEPERLDEDEEACQAWDWESSIVSDVKEEEEPLEEAQISLCLPPQEEEDPRNEETEAPKEHEEPGPTDDAEGEGAPVSDEAAELNCTIEATAAPGAVWTMSLEEPDESEPVGADRSVQGASPPRSQQPEQANALATELLVTEPQDAEALAGEPRATMTSSQSHEPQITEAHRMTCVERARSQPKPADQPRARSPARPDQVPEAPSPPSLEIGSLLTPSRLQRQRPTQKSTRKAKKSTTPAKYSRASDTNVTPKRRKLDSSAGPQSPAGPCELKRLAQSSSSAAEELRPARRPLTPSRILLESDRAVLTPNKIMRGDDSNTRKLTKKKTPAKMSKTLATAAKTPAKQSSLPAEPSTSTACEALVTPTRRRLGSTAASHKSASKTRSSEAEAERSRTHLTPKARRRPADSAHQGPSSSKAFTRLLTPKAFAKTSSPVSAHFSSVEQGSKETQLPKTCRSVAKKSIPKTTKVPSGRNSSAGSVKRAEMEPRVAKSAGSSDAMELERSLGEGSVRRSRPIAPPLAPKSLMPSPRSTGLELSTASTAPPQRAPERCASRGSIRRSRSAVPPQSPEPSLLTPAPLDQCQPPSPAAPPPRCRSALPRAAKRALTPAALEEALPSPPPKKRGRLAAGKKTPAKRSKSAAPPAKARRTAKAPPTTPKPKRAPVPPPGAVRLSPLRMPAERVGEAKPRALPATEAPAPRRRSARLAHRPASSMAEDELIDDSPLLTATPAKLSTARPKRKKATLPSVNSQGPGQSASGRKQPAAGNAVRRCGLCKGLVEARADGDLVHAAGLHWAADSGDPWHRCGLCGLLFISEVAAAKHALTLHAGEAVPWRRPSKDAVRTLARLHRRCFASPHLTPS